MHIAQALLVFLFLSLCLPSAVHAQKPAPLKLHFIGNSYTSYNNLPKLVETLSASVDRPVTTSRSLSGGAWLKRHWENPKVLQQVKAAKPDVLILQEQSQLAIIRKLPAKQGGGDGRKVFHTHARKWAAEAKKIDASVCFYMTWARRDIPTQTEDLAEAYGTIAAELGAKAAPVGPAFAIAKAAGAKLYAKDGSHPSKAGSYLAACVFTATLHGIDPTTIPDDVPGVPVQGKEAAKLQRAAAKAMKAPAPVAP